MIGIGSVLVGVGLSFSLYVQALHMGVEHDQLVSREVSSLLASQVARTISGSDISDRPLSFLAGGIDLRSLKQAVAQVPRIQRVYIVIPKGTGVLQEGFTAVSAKEGDLRSFVQISRVADLEVSIKDCLVSNSRSGEAKSEKGDLPDPNTAVSVLRDSSGNRAGALVVQLSTEFQKRRSQKLLESFITSALISIAVSLALGGGVGAITVRLNKRSEYLSNQIGEQAMLVDVMNESLSTLQQLHVESEATLENVLSASGTVVYHAVRSPELETGWTLQVLNSGAHVESLIGTSMSEGSYQAWGEAKFPGDHERYVQLVDEVIQSGGDFGKIEYRLLLNNGDYRWIREDFHVERSEGNVCRLVGICVDISVEKTRELAMEKMAYFDPITGLCNRYHLPSRVNKLFAEAKKLTAVVIVIENYGDVNLRRGHEVGDSLMRRVADGLSELCFSYGVLGRLGAAEFCVIGEISLERASALVESIHEFATQPIQSAGFSDQIQVRAAVVIEETPLEVTELIRKGSLAVSESVKTKEERFVLYDQSLERAALSRISMQADLALAIDKQELFVVYQPIIDVETEKISKVESLLRWKHPERGMISPAVFIPLAEESGMVSRLTEYVYRTALTDIHELNSKMGVPLSVSVNVSPTELGQGGLIESFTNVAGQIGISTELITLEVTESSAMDSCRAASEILSEFHDRGFQVALDDFGSGYSSMAYLSRLPLDIVKIDKSIIDHCHESEQANAVLEAICGVAKALDLIVLCEGVESKAQVEVVSSMGTQFIQGYYYSKPLTIDKLNEFCGVSVAAARQMAA